MQIGYTDAAAQRLAEIMQPLADHYVCSYVVCRPHKSKVSQFQGTIPYAVRTDHADEEDRYHAVGLVVPGGQGRLHRAD